ncbi:Uncharacterised protein [Klebsiella pneumoniae]|nr:hypothetical protein AI3048V1_4858 [Klebsiella pneumoniae]CAH6248633.1 hypothetical protein AI3048V1_4858 [Klebsiella pneumoniae]SLO62140.1 Uncharacterised protein [Klebsiella pneumoniae]
MVAVDFQRLADHQLNLERRLILLLRQLNNLTLHAFFRFRERRDFFQRLVCGQCASGHAGGGQQRNG